jgi:hypothetical protein
MILLYAGRGRRPVLGASGVVWSELRRVDKFRCWRLGVVDEKQVEVEVEVETRQKAKLEVEVVVVGAEAMRARVRGVRGPGRWVMVLVSCIFFASQC